MSRRSTPERIDAAHRAGTRNRLIGEGATEDTADAWLAAWEAKAAQDGLERGQAYWQAGWDWIAAQRKTRKVPDGLTWVLLVVVASADEAEAVLVKAPGAVPRS